MNNRRTRNNDTIWVCPYGTKSGEFYSKEINTEINKYISYHNLSMHKFSLDKVYLNNNMALYIEYFPIGNKLIPAIPEQIYFHFAKLRKNFNTSDNHDSYFTAQQRMESFLTWKEANATTRPNNNGLNNSIFNAPTRRLSPSNLGKGSPYERPLPVAPRKKFNTPAVERSLSPPPFFRATSPINKQPTNFIAPTPATEKNALLAFFEDEKLENLDPMLLEDENLISDLFGLTPKP